MDLAYVDYLAKDDNVVKCLLVRQDLFDRNVDAKGMKTEGSRDGLSIFEHDYNLIQSWNFGSTREQNFLEIFRN